MHAYYEALEAAVRAPASRTAALDALIDPACKCKQIVRVLATEAEHGRRADYSLTVRDVAALDVASTRVTVDVTVEQSDGRLYDAGGRVVDTIRASTNRYFIELRRHGTGWRVRRVSEP